jgi:hypothetical protein
MTMIRFARFNFSQSLAKTVPVWKQIESLTDFQGVRSFFFDH